MGNIIELKKHLQQPNDSSSAINVDKKILTPVYDFDCPVPLYSDEEGHLYTAFYFSATGKTVAMRYFDNVESIFENEKQGKSKINMVASEFR